VNAFLVALQAILNAKPPAAPSTAAASPAAEPGSADPSPDDATNGGQQAKPSDPSTGLPDASLVVPAVMLAAHSAMAAAALLVPALQTGPAAAGTPQAAPVIPANPTEHGSAQSSDPGAAPGGIALDGDAWQAVVDQLMQTINAALAGGTTGSAAPTGISDSMPENGVAPTVAGAPPIAPGGAGIIPGMALSAAMAAVVKSVDVVVAADTPPPPSHPPVIATVSSAAPPLTAAIVAAVAGGSGRPDSGATDDGAHHDSRDDDRPATPDAANQVNALATTIGAGAPAMTVTTAAPPVAAAPAPPPPPPAPLPSPTAHVTMTLDQAATGASRIRIAVQGSAVRATILTSSDGVNRMDRELPTLRQALADQGFSDVRVSVRVDDITTSAPVNMVAASPVTDPAAMSSARPNGQQQDSSRQSSQQHSQQQAPGQQRSPRQGRQQQQEDDDA
jgi:hypothetical protein